MCLQIVQRDAMVSETIQEESSEAWRQALLSKIAGEDELTGEELERHDQFLKAKEEALAALSSQQETSTKKVAGHRRSQQVRFEGKAFDEETARKLDVIAGRAVKDGTRREMERSKQATQEIAAARARLRVLCKQRQSCPTRRQPWRHRGSPMKSTRSLGILSWTRSFETKSGKKNNFSWTVPIRGTIQISIEIRTIRSFGTMLHGSPSTRLCCAQSSIGIAGERFG